MSNKTPANAPSLTLSARLRHLEAGARKEQLTASKRAQGLLWLGMAALVFCLASLGFVTTKAFQLDALALSKMGREALERELPGRLEQLESYLGAQAPTVCSQLLRAAIELLPGLREALARDVESRLQRIVTHYEQQLDVAIQDALEKSKQAIEEVPGRTDDERLTLLVTKVAEDFRAVTRATTATLYPQYTAEFDRIQGFLVDLQFKDESTLTRRERIQKELVETLLRLLAREGVN